MVVKKIVMFLLKNKVTNAATKAGANVVKNRKSLLDISLRDLGKATKKSVKKGLLKVVNKI